ncbi:MAG TPA: hypothetical protein DDW93_05715 [Firmicutes bacterium]|jgi:ZIP family zinc transporter|nr:hypothetical protein [Bacillota bacterium]HBK69199.1 hypothetical protein [Bacillota bacterium]HBT18054.1 hypothetical protein [Bacillota bacterium]
MGVVFSAAILGLLVGIIGAGLGGLTAILVPKITQKQQSELVGFSGGVMLGVVIWDLIPEAWGLGATYASAGFFWGIIFILLLRKYYQVTDETKESTRFTKAGILLGIGIALHNFPEGVAVGTVFTTDPTSALWWELSLLMAIHNIPEGLAVATTLRLGKTSWSQIALALILAELPMCIGALLGGILGTITAPWTAVSLGFAGGAMLMLVCVELVPIAWRMAGWFPTVIGLGTGLGSAWLLTILIS